MLYGGESRAALALSKDAAAAEAGMAEMSRKFRELEGIDVKVKVEASG